MSINSSETAALNASIAKFDPPKEKVPQDFDNSFLSQLPSTYRKGVIAGVKID